MRMRSERRAFVALGVLFAHLTLLERWLATTTTTGPNRTPEERCKGALHCKL